MSEIREIRIMKECACKGIRTCLKCEPERSQGENVLRGTDIAEYVYCPKCENKAYLSGQQYDDHECDPQNCDGLVIDGVFLQDNVLTVEEEQNLIESIDNRTWVDSQSGRRKQDFGPKINFKKKKINFDSFVGLPEIDMSILERIKCQRLRPSKDCERFEWPSVDAFQPEGRDNILQNFKTVEVCHLEYIPERGSAIDPHFDDFWIWGERLVTLNLLSSTVITLSHDNTLVRVNLPPRSILVLYGDARYKYKHAIERNHVTSRRLAITYRELPSTFLQTNNTEYLEYGKAFIKKSNIIVP